MPYSTGMVRRVDPLGRIVIPMELRRTMNIKSNDPLEVLVDGENIIVRKFGVQPNYEKMWNELKSNNKIPTELVDKLETKYANG